MAKPVQTPGTPPPPSFRCGLAALVGRTNAGKSTLLNALVGTKISIVTPKPQTTRDTLQGVVNRPEGQIVFVDTPGFFKTHASALVDSLHARALEVVKDVDVVVHVADPSRALGPEDEMVLAALESLKQPKILCLTKKDLHQRPHRKEWAPHFSKYAEVIDVSALAGNNLKKLCRLILLHLPAGHALYPPDQVSNAHRTYQIGEIIREQVYLLTDEEVPYRTAVQVDRVDEVRSREKGAPPVLQVRAVIFTANERYQRMLIGAGASMIKQITTAARQELKRALGLEVILDVDVIVSPRLLE